MKVTEVTARFLRRVQVAEYQPAEAEVTVKLTASEDSPGPDSDKAQDLIDSALKQAKTGVINILISGTQKQTPAPVVQPGTVAKPAAETPPAAPPKAEEPKPAAAKPSKAKKDANSEIPDAAAKKEEPKAAASEIPDSVPPAATTAPAATGEAVMTPTELQSYVTDEIKGKRLNVPQMREVMDAFKIIRLGDLDTPDKLKGFKAKIDETIVTNGFKPGGKN